MSETEVLDYTVLPAHLRRGLEEYIERGHIPGQFLSAVLSNDLMGAFAHGDETSKAALDTIIKFMWNEAPSACWGSKTFMTGWSASGGSEGRRRDV